MFGWEKQLLLEVNNMFNFDKLASKPLIFRQNRVWRTYEGGGLLDKFKDNPHCFDARLPEEWIASDTVARNTGRDFLKEEGLSEYEVSEGVKVTLKRIIKEKPVAVLGAKHVDYFGVNIVIRNNFRAYLVFQ